MTEQTPLDQISQINNGIQGVANTVKNQLNLPYDVNIVITFFLSFQTWTWGMPQEFLDAGVKVIIDVGNVVKLSNFLSYEAISRDFLHVVLERTFDTHAGETIKANTLYFEPSYTS
jgi:hypothetical protein